MEGRAQLVWQESTRHREHQHSMVIARTATRASTEMLQDKPLKHPARPVSRASISWEQEDPVRHLARHVPRTRTRLLRAVFKPPALATQATVETPAQEHVQRA